MPRKSAIGRVACLSLSGFVDTRWQSVSWVRFDIFYKGRLSSDLVLVKELQENWQSSRGVTEARRARVRT